YLHSQAAEPSVITAERFGTISISGDAANILLGDLDARLTNRSTSGSALTSATVANQLGNTWDLAGSVGTVKAVRTVGWNLGPNGAGALHPAGVTAATSLALGFVNGATVSVTGALASLKANELLAGIIRAGS